MSGRQTSLNLLLNLKSSPFKEKYLIYTSFCTSVKKKKKNPNHLIFTSQPEHWEGGVLAAVLPHGGGRIMYAFWLVFEAYLIFRGSFTSVSLVSLVF